MGTYSVYLFALVSVLLVSGLSLLGAFMLAKKESFVRASTVALISVAVGALLGDAFIHLIPEAFEGIDSGGTVSLLVIVGILAFFALEKGLHWHHHGEDTDHVHPVGKLILVSDAVHNFLDGMIIAASFLVSVPVGVATTIAVMLHEIPQEMGDFAVLLHAGYEKRKALWLNFLSALTAFAGALFLFLLQESAERVSALLLPIASGGFIYIAMADLIPELHKTKDKRHSFWQLLLVVLGVGAMWGLTFLE